jgi:hypothetical protein
MRRALVLFACGLLLAGCESYGDLTSDAFDPGGATQSKFAFDNGHCQAAATDELSYNMRGIMGTHVERHEMYNRVYTRCMQRNGYARRNGLDIAVPYDVDPWPG